MLSRYLEMKVNKGWYRVHALLLMINQWEFLIGGGNTIMSKKRIHKSKKDCLSIYRFMDNWLDVKKPIWNKMHHKEMKTYLLIKGYHLPKNASMHFAEKQDHLENDYLYVRDAAGTIACYHNPQSFHPNQLLQELQTVSQEELQRRRQTILQQMATQEIIEPQTEKVKTKKKVQGGN